MKWKYVLLFLAVSLFILPFAITNIDSDHDGILLKPALDVASGKVLFLDTFTQYGALTVFIQAAAFKITPFLLGIRLSAVFAYAFLSVFLYLIWRRFLTEKLTFISLALWLSLAPFYNYYFHSWSSVYALVFQTGTLLSLFRYFERRNRLYLAASGVGASLTFWTRQPVGAFTVLAVLLLFILMWRLEFISLNKALTNIMIVLLGIVVASFPFFWYLAGKGALLDWWRQSFLAASSWATAVRGISVDQVLKSLSIAKFWKELHLYFIWIAMPLAIVSLFFHTMLNKKRKNSNQNVSLLSSCLILFASWMQYYPMAEPSHFFWAATPMVGFFVYVLYRFFSPRPARYSPLATLFTAVIIIVFLWRVSVGAGRVLKADQKITDFPLLTGVRVTREEKKEIESFKSMLTNYVEEHKTYINTSPDSFVSLIVPDRFHNFPPVYSHWDFLDKVYTDYLSKVQSYVQQRHPVFVTRWGPYFDDYCRIDSASFFDPKTNLYVFRPGIIQLKRGPDGTLSIQIKEGVSLKSVLLKEGDTETHLKAGALVANNFHKEQYLLFAIEYPGFERCTLFKSIPL